MLLAQSRNPSKIQVPFKMLALDIADDNSIKSFDKAILLAKVLRCF